MAIDTKAKRQSVLGVYSSAPRLLPIPAGKVARIARHQLGEIYVGLTTQVLVPTFCNSNATSRLLSRAEVAALLS